MRQAQSSGAGGSRSTVGGLQGSFPASPSQPTHTGRARGAISQRHHMATWKFMLLEPGLHGCEGVPGAWGLVRKRPGPLFPPNSPGCTERSWGDRLEGNTLRYRKILEWRKIKYYMKHRGQKRKRLTTEKITPV